MGEASVLRYDDVPLDDFMVSLAQHEQDVRVGFLPKAAHLKEARFSVRRPADLRPVEIYLLQET